MFPHLSGQQLRLAAHKIDSLKIILNNKLLAKCLHRCPRVTGANLSATPTLIVNRIWVDL